jgi:predicted nucleotidyltransferase
MKPIAKTEQDNFKIVGNWEAKVKSLKENFPQLTDKDLMFLPDQEVELITRLAERLHKSREEVKRILNLV